jgi:polysaccharide biosynthesis/export protein
MTKAGRTQARLRRLIAHAMALVMGLGMGGLGCADHEWRAAKLPVDLLAPSRTNIDRIDLSKLADYSTRRELIDRGDVLDVSMVVDYSKLKSETTPLRVADDGTINVPLVGVVPVGGLRVEEAEREIGRAAVGRGVFRDPCITVSMKQERTNHITVVGAVVDPGTFELSRGATSLMAAIVAAGGLMSDATTDVEIRHRAAAGGVDVPRVATHPGEQVSFERIAATPAVVHVNLISASKEGKGGFALDDGDVVYVAKQTLKPIYVIGLVRKPGEYQLPSNQDMRVLDALALAGGMSNSVADNLLIIRHLPGHDEPIKITATVQSAKTGQDNITLAPGDTLSVEQTPATVVVDAIQTFFRVGFSAAMPGF